MEDYSEETSIYAEVMQMYSILFSSKEQAEKFAEEHGGTPYESSQGSGNWIVYKGTNQEFMEVYRRRLSGDIIRRATKATP